MTFPRRWPDRQTLADFRQQSGATHPWSVAPFPNWNRFLGFLIIMIPMLVMAFSVQSLNAEAPSNSSPLPKILRDWEKRGREISAVTYVLSGTKTWSRDGTLSSTQVTGELSAVVALDFKNNRCRLESVIPDYAIDARRLYEIRTISVGAEGKTTVHILQNTDPHLKQTEIEDFLILKGNAEMIPASRMGDSCFYPIFHASGVIPTAQHRVKTSNINPGLTSEAFVFEGYETNQGRSLAKLRVDYNQRYQQTNWYLVDLERDSAVVKTIVQTGVATNGPLTIREVDYSFTNGFWLPHQWSAMHYGMGGILQLAEKVLASEIRVQATFPDNIFALAPTPGMKVLEIDHQLDLATQRLVVQKSNYRLNSAGAIEQQSTKRESLDIGRTDNSKRASPRGV